MHPFVQAADRSAPSIRVELDSEGLRIAMMELLEEGFQRSRMERLGGEGMSEESRTQQMEAITKKRSISVGYYSFALHIFRLDAERAVGLELDPHMLAYFEGSALRSLAACRNEYRYRHPTCGRCGTEQENRFHPKCTNCGGEFGGKKKR